jgi:uncharacterized membrane protein YkvA (DUF1232 family)
MNSKRAQQQADEFTEQATEADVQRIESDLSRMKRGPIKEIWAKVIALFTLIKDPDAPWGSKAIAIGSLIYLISPIDAVPDIIPMIGLSDDAAVILAAITKLALDLKKYSKATTPKPAN